MDLLDCIMGLDKLSYNSTYSQRMRDILYHKQGYISDDSLTLFSDEVIDMDDDISVNYANRFGSFDHYEQVNQQGGLTWECSTLCMAYIAMSISKKEGLDIMNLSQENSDYLKYLIDDWTGFLYGEDLEVDYNLYLNLARHLSILCNNGEDVTYLEQAAKSWDDKYISLVKYVHDLIVDICDNVYPESIEDHPMKGKLLEIALELYFGCGMLEDYYRTMALFLRMEKPVTEEQKKFRQYLATEGITFGEFDRRVSATDISEVVDQDSEELGRLYIQIDLGNYMMYFGYDLKPVDPDYVCFKLDVYNKMFSENKKN